jgi:hypothetical protein
MLVYLTPGKRDSTSIYARWDVCFLVPSYQTCGIVDIRKQCVDAVTSLSSASCLHVKSLQSILSTLYYERHVTRLANSCRVGRWLCSVVL